MKVSSTTFSSYVPLTLSSVAPEETDSTVSPPGRRSRALWLGPLRWIQENTFSPSWLPDPLRHPLIGYVLAGLIELAAAALMLLLTSVAPMFAFHGILVLVGVVLIAVGWVRVQASSRA